MKQTDVDQFVSEIDAILRKHGTSPVGADLIRQAVTRHGRAVATVGLGRLKTRVAATDFLRTL